MPTEIVRNFDSSSILRMESTKYAFSPVFSTCRLRTQFDLQPTRLATIKALVSLNR